MVTKTAAEERGSGEKLLGRQRNLLVILLIISLLLFSWLKIQSDQVVRKRVPGSSIIYLPSGKYLKYATFGYSSLVADLIYLWAIQYYGAYEIADRFKYLEHIFSIIAELDPKYVDPYEVGALIAVYDAHDPQLAFKILDMGLEKNPDMWIFPFQAGHIAQMNAKDYELAREYYRKAMEIPGAPPIVKRLYANASYRTMNYQEAWEMWKEIYETSKEDWVKEIAYNHLYRVKATVDTEALAEAVKKFRERYGRWPSDLNQLVPSRLIREVPKDLDGKDYLYDSKTGEVKPARVWWKR
ncbi:MAG: tetratricopeptide repeat protein [Candidatus Saccharicenans sp.]